MRITRELLHKYAQQSAEQMAHQDRKILCVYLTGSLLTPEPLLGHTTDIDLFVIYNDTPPVSRQVTPINDDIHLDIAYLPQTIFRQPRQQRVDPWLAPFLCQNPICLHDTQHWFEFTQAAVCSQYDRPEYRMQRARPFIEKARQAWMDINLGKTPGFPAIINQYVASMENAANAIASLCGAPLAGRRFLLQYPKRCTELGRPGLSGGLVDLFFSQAPSAEEWEVLFSGWKQAMQEVAALPSAPASLSNCRIKYYEQGASVLRDDHPEACLWIMLKTWTRCITLLSDKSPALPAWQAFCESLDLGVEHLDMRLESLDTYLDTVDETMDKYCSVFGVS